MKAGSSQDDKASKSTSQRGNSVDGQSVPSEFRNTRTSDAFKQQTGVLRSSSQKHQYPESTKNASLKQNKSNLSAIGSTAITPAAYASAIGTVNGFTEAAANWKNSSGTFPKRTSSAIRGSSRDKLPGIVAHQKLHSFNMRCENLIFNHIGRTDR